MENLKCCVLTFVVICSVTFSVQEEKNGCVYSETTLVCTKARGKFLQNGDWESVVHLFILDSDMAGVTKNDLLLFRDVEVVKIINTSSFRPEEHLIGHLKGVKEVGISKCNVTDNILRALIQNANIEILNLSHNKIAGLKRNSLRSFQSLEEIDLSHNTIANIELGAFEGLHVLRTVTLANNKLSVVNKGTFGDLHRVEKIDLSNNRIVHVDVGAFKELTLLKTLDLSSNRIGEFFSPAHLNANRQQCHLCAKKWRHGVCTTDDLTYCKFSLSVDDLWGKFATHDLNLKDNPLCKIITNERKYVTKAVVNLVQAVSSDRCVVFNQGSCFRHESRRIFLRNACAVGKDNTSSIKYASRMESVWRSDDVGHRSIETINFIFGVFLVALCVYLYRHICYNRRKRKRNVFGIL